MRKNRSHEAITSDDGGYVVKKNKKLNIVALIVCVVVSFCIWLYVMNTQNNDYTKTFTITVEAINAERLEDETGLSVFGMSETQASVTISGKKSDIQKYTERDFRAYIDVSAIDQTGYASLNVAVELPTSDVKLMTVEPQKVTVYADRMQTKTIDLVAYCNYGENDNKRFTFDKDRQPIEISGPSAFVDKIFDAQVEIPCLDYEEGTIIPISMESIKFHDNSEAHQVLSSLYIVLDTEQISVKVTGVIENE